LLLTPKLLRLLEASPTPGLVVPTPGTPCLIPGRQRLTPEARRLRPRVPRRRGRSRGGRGAAGRRTDTRDPRRARERALKILFQADVRGVNPVVTLQRLADDPAARAMLDDADDLTEEQELLAQAASDAEAGTTEARPCRRPGSTTSPGRWCSASPTTRRTSMS
jgi:hypothetical protein